MQWYVVFISIVAVGAVGWLALEMIGRPVRKFFDLRRSARDQFPLLADIPAPQPRETCVTSVQIRQYDADLKNTREAQRVLRELASRMLAFAGSERAACIAIKPFGFDPAVAGNGMTALADILDRHCVDRTGFRRKVERALRLRQPVR